MGLEATFFLSFFTRPADWASRASTLIYESIYEGRAYSPVGENTWRLERTERNLIHFKWGWWANRIRNKLCIYRCL